MSYAKSADIKKLSYPLRDALRDLNHPVPLQVCLEGLCRAMTGNNWNDQLALEKQAEIDLRRFEEEAAETNRWMFEHPDGPEFRLPLPTKFPVYGSDFQQLSPYLDKGAFDLASFRALQQSFFRFLDLRTAWTEKDRTVLSTGWPQQAILCLPPWPGFLHPPAEDQELDPIKHQALANIRSGREFLRKAPSLADYPADIPAPAPRQEPACTDCEGQGFVYICPDCRGTGEVEDEDERDFGMETECELCDQNGFFTATQAAQRKLLDHLLPHQKEREQRLCYDCLGSGIKQSFLDHRGYKVLNQLVLSLAPGQLYLSEPVPLDDREAPAYCVLFRTESGASGLMAVARIDSENEGSHAP